MKTAMQELKELIQNHDDMFILKNDLLCMINELMPVEEKQTKDAYDEGYNTGRHEGEHVDY